MKTDFTQITFDPKNHSYTYPLDGRVIPLTSVSSVCKTLEEPFDRDAVSLRISAREGRAVPDILAEWEAKGKASRELGSQVHEYIRIVLTGQAPPQDPITAINSILPEIRAFDGFWREARIYMGVREIEWVIGDIDYGLAGTIDALIYHKETRMFHLLDWKTGKFSSYNNFGKLRQPFADLDAGEMQKYSLQLGLYRLILERNADLPAPVGDSYLVHLNGYGHHQVYKALDLGDRLEKWLEEKRPISNL
jgi:ATP-dependent exoDNAse (exonuclease V) beta subunit